MRRKRTDTGGQPLTSSFITRVLRGILLNSPFVILDESQKAATKYTEWESVHSVVLQTFSSDVPEMDFNGEAKNWPRRRLRDDESAFVSLIQRKSTCS